MLSRTTNLSIDYIEIEDDGYHLLITAKINGRNARLLVDTGASRTVFDHTRIQNFLTHKNFVKHGKLSTGLGTDSMETSSATIKTFRIGELALKEFHTVLLDLSHVNNTYDKLGYAPIDGVLGNDILVDHYAIINYRKMQLSLNLKRSGK
jgi:hypothetical protein